MYYHLAMRTKRWDIKKLRLVVKKSKSVRQVIYNLGLIPAGGNYDQIKKYLKVHNIDTSHFTGQGWNKGMRGIGKLIIPTKDILRQNSNFQSYKLKSRLFKEGFKFPKCEECGWARMGDDGRIPVEIDHINGDRKDNRLVNLRILCPNCHSLKPTHRGKNKKRRDGGMVDTQHLKCCGHQSPCGFDPHSRHSEKLMV